MSAFNASEEELAAAEAYESLHVPAIFDQWPPLLVEAARITANQRVLDVACGTGVLARHCQSIVGEGCEVTGVDIGSGMLALASRLSPSINWNRAAAESLPFEDDSFDAVVSQFGLMFFEDRTKALKEMVRVLVPNGSLAVAVWASLESSEAYPQEVELLEKLAGEKAAQALRAPFALGNIDELTSLFRDIGADTVSVTTYQGKARFPSIRTMVEADLRGWLPVMGVELSEDLIEAILAEADSVLNQYLNKDGSVAFTAPAHIATYRKKHPE